MCQKVVSQTPREADVDTPVEIVGDVNSLNRVRPDLQIARKNLPAADVIPMLDAESIGVSTRQRVNTVLSRRFASWSPVEPNAVLALLAAKLNHNLQNRLMPVAKEMDTHGSHGVSMRQLLRQYVNSLFSQASADPLAGDDVLLNKTGEWHGTPVLRTTATNFLRKRDSTKSLVSQLPDNLATLAENDPGKVPDGHIRLYRATTLESASEMLADQEVDLDAREPRTDFGKAVYTTPHLQYALWYAYYNVCAVDQNSDVALLVFDVPIAELGKVGLFEAKSGDWKILVSACRRSKIKAMKKDHPELHSNFTNADVVQGHITANATGVDCGKEATAEKFDELAFRTDKGVDVLLNSGCKLFIRFSPPHTWGEYCI